eukprot:3931736-Rhodomonas_salina.1
MGLALIATLVKAARGTMPLTPRARLADRVEANRWCIQSFTVPTVRLLRTTFPLRVLSVTSDCWLSPAVTVSRALRAQSMTGDCWQPPAVMSSARVESDE